MDYNATSQSSVRPKPSTMHRLTSSRALRTSGIWEMPMEEKSEGDQPTIANVRVGILGAMLSCPDLAKT